MSLSQQIINIWTASPYSPPKIPLIFHENQYMATVSDTDTFLRFISVDGQIFLALNFNCKQAAPDPSIGNSVYICSKVDPILCSPTSGPDNARDIFVLNKIIPLLH